MVTQRLRVLVLTEDSGAQAHQTLVQVLKKAYKLVDADVQTHRIAFEPANEDQRRAMRANLWKSAAPRDHRARVDLVRSIATVLGMDGPPGFVAFHFDADQPWSQRASSENIEKFERLIAARVDQSLSANGLRTSPARIHRIVPNVCMESWLFQATDVGAGLCRGAGCGKHVALFSGWAADRRALDEVRDPKAAVACLADRHNAEHAAAFPAAVVAKAQPSFAHVVAALQADARLVAALRETSAVDESGA